MQCSKCGQTFEQDPALSVPCPSCGVDAGQRCERPSNHTCRTHTGRDRLALVAVDEYEPCPESDGESPAEAARKLLGDGPALQAALSDLDIGRDDIEAVVQREQSRPAATPVVTDGGEIDVPDLPAGWVTATNQPDHLSLLNADGDGRSITVMPTQPQGSDGWTALGLANCSPECPVFVEGVPVDVARGEDVDPVRVAGSEPDTGPTGNSGDGETQATLADF